MFGVVVRELSYLKILAPIMHELTRQNTSYILYHFDAPRGDKEYNRATLAGIKQSNPELIQNAKKVKAFPNDKHLRKQLKHDKTTGLISLEVYLWAHSYIQSLRKEGIRIYNILYLTDSLWSSDPKVITTSDRVYYSSQYLMNLQLKFLGLNRDPNRDRWLGSPLYDPLNKGKGDDGLLVMMPNLKPEHVKVALGGKDTFLKDLRKICGDHENVVFKSRKKQWLPPEIKNMGRVVQDGIRLYPPIISELFNQCSHVLMFYSSGVYEAVYAEKCVINMPLNIKRWPWDKKKMREYFDNGVYNSPGVVHSIQTGRYFKEFSRDSVAAEEWQNKYIGQMSLNSASRIVKDIIKNRSK